MTRNDIIQYLIREHGGKTINGTVTADIWDANGALRGCSQ